MGNEDIFISALLDAAKDLGASRDVDKAAWRVMLAGQHKNALAGIVNDGVPLPLNDMMECYRRSGLKRRGFNDALVGLGPRDRGDADYMRGHNAGAVYEGDLKDRENLRLLGIV